MFREMIEEFVRDCVARVAAGDQLDDDAAAAFRRYLDFRERCGPPLLGRFASGDGSFDTVTGRCGHRPLFIREL